MERPPGKKDDIKNNSDQITDKLVDAFFQKKFKGLKIDITPETKRHVYFLIHLLIDDDDNNPPPQDTYQSFLKEEGPGKPPPPGGAPALKLLRMHVAIDAIQKIKKPYEIDEPKVEKYF